MNPTLKFLIDVGLPFAAAVFAWWVLRRKKKASE
jgi:hypothetical protein